MSTEPESRRCEVAGHNLAYLEAGSGEPVLLIHGITTYSFIWRRIIPLLATDYRVLAVDLLGCGGSDKPLDVPYTLRNHAELLLEFADTLRLDRFHLVGHDVGGGIAQIFAVRDPARLYDVSLVNSVGYDYWPVQPISSLRAPVIRQLLMATMDSGALKLVVRRGLYHKEQLTVELMDLFWESMRGGPARKAFLHFARCLDNQDLVSIEEDIRQMEVPILIVRGDGDVYLSSEISARLHRDVPGSRLVHIERGGHFIQEDEPEAVAGALVDFFRRDRGDCAS